MPEPSESSKISNTEDQAIDWYLRLRSEHLTEEEIDEFAAWLEKKLEHRAAYSRIEKLYDNMVIAARDLELSGEYENVGQKKPAELSKSPTKQGIDCAKSRIPIWQPVATAFALGLILFFLLQPGLLSRRHGLVYQTGKGTIQSIDLGDGSRVLLDTDSQISVHFDDHVRDINLDSGKARFTVIPDPERTFSVYAGKLKIESLSTVFDVYAATSGEISITVEEHAVAVTVESKELDGDRVLGKAVTPVRIDQGQRLIYQPGQRLGQPRPIDKNVANAWTGKRLIINDRPFAELIDELGRYHPRRIFLFGRNLNQLNVSGVFSLQDPDKALESICNALHLKRTQIGPWWIIVHG